MDPKNTITSFLHNATGGNAGGRHKLTLEKKTFIQEGVAKSLRDQWNAAGRDNASVFLKLTEADGKNAHYVTGWDGKDTFVCFTESGLTYIPYRKLQGMVIDETWDTKTRLVHVRAPVLRKTMEQTTVDVLLKKARTIKVEGKDKEVTKPGKKSPFAFQPQKPNQEVPEEPPGRNKYEWRSVDEATGKVKRRGLNHPMMKGKDQATKSGANGETNQNVTTRQEALDAQLDKRNQVKLNSEGGKQKGAGKGEANKSDAQMDKRQHVELRQEACGAGCGYKGPMRHYSGESVKCPECGARQHVDVRTEEKKVGKAFGHPVTECKTRHPGKSHEEWTKTRFNLNVNSKTEAEVYDHPGADCKTFHPKKTHKIWAARRWNLNSRGSKAETPLGESKITKGKELFGGKKAAPFGAKKPLLMMMLIKKGKRAKKEMSEAVNPDPRRHSVSCMGCGVRHGNPMGPAVHVKTCPACEGRRKDTGGGLKLSLQKGQSAFESLTRSSLTLVSEEDSAWAHWKKFHDNAMKMKNGHPSFRRRKKDSKGTSVSVMADKPEVGGEAHPHTVEPAHSSIDTPPQHQ